MRRLDLAGFDAAVAVGNSFGYHSDDENLMSLDGIATAVVVGGTVIIELLNRDRIVANFRPHSEHIAGDGQRRQRRTEQRLYTPPELAAMCAAVGLIPVAWHDGLAGWPFHVAARRLGLVAVRG